MENKINLSNALGTFGELWDPRIVGTVNDYDVRIVHIQGDFTWHSHIDTDELFLILAGSAMIHLRDRTIHLDTGDLFVVPRGVEHKPESIDGADLLLFEPSGTTNTGDGHEEVPEHIKTTAGKTL